MSTKIKMYAELQEMIRKALREQHPEWIDAHGESAICDAYEARFAELLVLFGAIQGQGRVEHDAARQRVASATVPPGMLSVSERGMPSATSCQAVLSRKRF